MVGSCPQKELCGGHKVIAGGLRHYYPSFCTAVGGDAAFGAGQLEGWLPASSSTAVRKAWYGFATFMPALLPAELRP